MPGPAIGMTACAVVVEAETAAASELSDVCAGRGISRGADFSGGGDSTTVGASGAAGGKSCAAGCETESASCCGEDDGGCSTLGSGSDSATDLPWLPGFNR